VFPGDPSFDPNYSSEVPIIFSSGDTFAEVQYPCASPTVTCVGGTHLLETGASCRNLESVWDGITGGGTGGGCSLFESEPRFRADSAPVVPNEGYRISLPLRTHIPECSSI
jgi:subtilase family serine protease